MKPEQFDEILNRTLDDGRFSRAERKVLQQLVREANPDERRLRFMQQRAFEAARANTKDVRDREVLDWLEELLKVLRPAEDDRPSVSEVHFSPGDGPRRRIVDLLDSARRQIDICVFTISDDRISEAIERAHRRGIRTRIITDDDKTFDLGSDVDRLFDAGIEVRVDRTPAHMHHKFAVFDRSIALTGSYNWTRSAAAENFENVVVLSDPRIVSRFQQEFDRLWGSLE